MYQMRFYRNTETHTHKQTKLFSPDVMAAMLVFSEQKNFDYFFCSRHQHGRYVYCLLCLFILCENQEYKDFLTACTGVVKKILVKLMLPAFDF